MMLTAARPEPIPAARLVRAKRSFTTRRIVLPAEPALLTARVAPRAGDLLLAQVESIGHHTRLELPDGRRAALYPGDEVLVVYADRYAPDQFEAEVPASLGPCDLVTAGGIAGHVLRRGHRAGRPTALFPLGLVSDAGGRPLSTRDFGLPPARLPPRQTHRDRPPVIGVVGSSMNAGKTTAAAAMIRAEVQLGRRVGVAKVTGTGSGGDLWSYRDAGAALALDFTDAGLPSTHRVPASELESVFETLLATLLAGGVDVAFIEVSDGVLFEGTAALVGSEAFRRAVDGVVFAAADGMGALAGETYLARAGLPLLALSGLFTRTPLTLDEVAACARAPVVTVGEMQAGAWLPTDALARLQADPV